MEWTSQREREARLLAGLDPVDDDTRRLGVGGPYLQIEPAKEISSSELREQLRQQELRLDALQRKLSFQKDSFTEVLQTMEAGREKLSRTPTICPVRSGYTLSSTFGHRTDPFTGRMGLHNGLDLRAAPGTAVVTTANGDGPFRRPQRRLRSHGEDRSRRWHLDGLLPHGLRIRPRGPEGLPRRPDRRRGRVGPLDGSPPPLRGPLAGAADRSAEVHSDTGGNRRVGRRPKERNGRASAARSAGAFCRSNGVRFRCRAVRRGSGMSRPVASEPISGVHD